MSMRAEPLRVADLEQDAHAVLTEVATAELRLGAATAPTLALVPPAEPLAPARARLVMTRVDRMAKRAVDVAVAAFTLLLLTPVLAVVALAIRLESRGPVFYRATRVGHGGRELRMLKFRKMHDSATGIPLTMDDDERFTRIGIWLAKFKLDELPQLWHVLTGEMSLVGPRPETPDFVVHHVDEYRDILSVRPGVVGWSQIAFAEESRILDDADPVGHYVAAILPQKVSLDLLYATTRNVLLDLRIVFWSVLAVALRRRVAVHRSDGRMNLRRR
jgi:lipopolysaccharide/colanic/teichoic acid biosynthesis glycosyltransferase